MKPRQLALLRQLHVVHHIQELREVMFGYCQPRFAPDEINKMLYDARVNDSSRCFAWEIKELSQMVSLDNVPMPSGWMNIPRLN